MIRKCCLIVIVVLLYAPVGMADAFAVDKDNSILGFIHHKKGIASIFVEDPLSYPINYEMTLEYDPDLETANFGMRYPVEEIEIAGEVELARWGEAIVREGASEVALKPPGNSIRRRVRKAILGKKLLEADKYPEIRATSISIEPLQDEAKTHQATIEIQMHGVTHRATFPLSVSLEADRLVVAAVFPLRMTDFNIKPYSAFLGTLRFQDEFHVFMHLEADRAE